MGMEDFQYYEERSHEWPRPLEGKTEPELAEVRGNGYLCGVIGEVGGVVSLALLQPGLAVVCAIIAGYGLSRVNLVNQEMISRNED